jgi:hypothetical protein
MYRAVGFILLSEFRPICAARKAIATHNFFERIATHKYAKHQLKISPAQAHGAAAGLAGPSPGRSG